MNEWLENSPYIIYDFLYLTILVFVSILFATKIHIAKFYYNRYILIVFYISILMLTIIRYFKSFSHDKITDYNPMFDSLLGYYPIIFMILATSIFLDYLLYSLYKRFSMSTNEVYGKYRLFLRIFIIIALPLYLVSGPICFYLGNKYKNKIWPNIPFYILSLSSLILGFFIICVANAYRNELKSYPLMFKSSKKLIIFVIIAVFIQIILKIVDGILISSGFFENLKKKETIYERSAYFIYILLSDILSLLAYTLYFRFDFFQLELVDSMRRISVDDNTSICTASVIESKLIKYLQEKTITSKDIIENFN